MIEDDQWLADSYLMMLRARGHDITQLSTAHEAMEWIAKQIPALIIADVLLGDHNTFTLFHELQSYSDTAKIPVIICTSLGSHKLSKADLTSYGIVDVLDKTTLTPDRLLVTVESHLPSLQRVER